MKFILIPGAWLGAWAWKKVVPFLEEKGHEAYPVTLTGMADRVHLASKELGMETAIEDVLNIIRYNGLDGISLVGHSFAGKVAAAVSDRAHDKIRRVIYLDSFRPERVRTPQGSFDPAAEFGVLPPGEFAFPLTMKTVRQIGKDLKGKELRWMMSRVTPWPAKLAKDPITLTSSYDAVKEAYVFCTLTGDPVDDIIAGKYGKLSGPYKVMETGHWPMITKPRELAKNLIALSR